MDLSKLSTAFSDKFPNDAIVQVTPLAGQASNRHYFRLSTRQGKQFVLMQLPEGAARGLSEEATSVASSPQELPFIAVQRYLNRLSIPVPRIDLYLEDEGQLLLEDVGDESLERAVRTVDEATRITRYRQAIDLLLDWQVKTQRTPDPACVAFKRRFDFELLMWECEHFLEYGVDDYWSLAIEASRRAEITAWFKRLCGELIELPQTLVHRDFQSRNLHVHEGRLVCIDFQDALVGPFVYDLVALLRDSYISLPKVTIDALLEYYWHGLVRVGLALQWDCDGEALNRAFHLQTLQRKLKDTGRFQYIHTVKHNDQFLSYRAPSLAYVHDAFLALPEYAPLYDQIRDWMTTDSKNDQKK